MPVSNAGDILRSGGRGYYSGGCGSLTARYCGVALAASLIVRRAGGGADAATDGHRLRPAGRRHARRPLDQPRGPDRRGAAGSRRLDRLRSVQGRRLVAFDIDSGRPRWVADAETTWAPAAGDGLVFVAMTGGVRALDAATGRVALAADAARRRPPRRPTGTPAGSWSRSRAEIWSRSAPLTVSRCGTCRSARWSRPPRCRRSTRCISASPTAASCSLDLATGRTNWTRQLEGAATGPARARRSARGRHHRPRGAQPRSARTGAAAGGGASAARRSAPPPPTIAASTSLAYDHLLRAVDRRSGNLRWRRAMPHRPAGSPLVVGTTVLVPSLSAEISTYDAATGDARVADHQHRRGRRRDAGASRRTAPAARG